MQLKLINLSSSTMKINKGRLKKAIHSCLVILFFGFNLVSAGEKTEVGELNSAFRSFSDVAVPSIAVPTVVEVPLDFSRNDTLMSVIVVERETQKNQPVLVVNKNVATKNNFTASDSIGPNGANFLIDGKMDNFQEYPANSSGDEQSVIINIHSDRAITTSALDLYLDRFVSLPKSIEVSAIAGGEEKTVLAKRDVSDMTVNFPKTTAQEFRIRLTYVQPLRIRELSFRQDDLDVAMENSFRFLAQPDKSYIVYFNADRYVDAYFGEIPDLNDNRDVVVLKKIIAIDNPAYQKSDVDADGVADEMDNCVTVENPEQEDVNNNGRGDACDDFDRDGIINVKDNCRDLPNRDQKDTDLDGVGNVCDGSENRILQNQKWLPLALILLVAGIIGIFFVKTIRTKK